MLRNILCCYVFLLTLLDLSLKTKLTAQGQSHGVSIQDSFVEGITFQEWDEETGLEEVEDTAQPDDDVEGVWVWPRTLRFGRVALGAAHSRTVTVTNRANATLHLASVAGTTPDFHASFFDSKTLAPAASASFSVVFLGRREGPAAAHLYLHTSLGVHKYPVSAVGEASPYGVWPLVGLRVPLNASVEPELTLYNPTDTTIQVHEVYSTGAWLGLQLPAGEHSAPGAAWAVPPRQTRALVRLRVAPPPHAQQPLTAYVRVKADVPGGGLLLAVEARAVPAGEHARPLHVRLSARGAGDQAHTVELELSNSGAAGVALEGGVSGAGCGRAAPPAPCAAPPAARANGGSAPGVRLALLRDQLAPHQDFVKVAQLTLDFAELWAGAAGGGAAREAWCAGCVRLGRALVPFSVRLLPGALRFTPPQLDVVTAGAGAARELGLRARNDFERELRVLAVTLPAAVAPYFEVESAAPLVLAAGAEVEVARVRLRASALPPDVSLRGELLVHTELTQYRVPLRLYSGRILFEWEWPNATDGALELGTVGTSATRRVGVRLRNPAPVPLCIGALDAQLPGAAATFARATPAPECVAAGAAAQAWLTVVAPAREGSLRGEVRLLTGAPHAAASTARLTLRVRAGLVRLLPLRLPPAAPYADSWAELQADNSMAVRMRVTSVTLPPRRADAALSFQWQGEFYGEVRPGRSRVARVRHSPQRRCEPACYCGLALASDEGAAWLARAAAPGAALPADAALLRARLALFDRQRAALDANFTLHMHTDEALQVEAAGAAPLAWPRFATAAAGRAPLAAVGSSAALRLLLRSEAHVPVLLQALLAAPPLALPDLPARAGGAAVRSARSAGAFRLAGWSVVRGAASPWNASQAGGAATPLLLLAPHTELELSVVFEPREAGSFAAHLYVRNNLTILEGVPLSGEGEYPSFDLSGRRPGSKTPILIEVTECAWGGEPPPARRLLARNTGRVAVQLGEWRVAGAPCAARGFALRPCAPLRLAPNASLPLLVHFTPDYTLARAAAALAVRTQRGDADFLLLATVPSAVLAQCAAAAPRPAWEYLLRVCGGVCAVLVFAVVLTAAALDADAVLRRARAARDAAEPRAPLDLRSLSEPAAPPPPAPARPPPRRRRPARRVPPPPEVPHPARWRPDPMQPADSSRSSDDDDSSTPPAPRAVRDDPASSASDDSAPPTSPRRARRDLPSSASDDSAAPTTPRLARRDRRSGTSDYSAAPRASRAARDDLASSTSDDSTPVDERDDEPYSADVEPDPPESESRRRAAQPAAPPAARAAGATPPAGAARRERREAAETTRRAERARLDAERRAPPRLPARKERVPKRRAPRVPPTPPPRSPAPAAPPAPPAPAAPPPPHVPREPAEAREAAQPRVTAEAREPTEAGEAREACEAGEARGALRPGASWSAVVAARASGALAPIGSDVKRREPEPEPERAQDNSLFYFNGAPDALAWRAPPAAYHEGSLAPGAPAAAAPAPAPPVWGAWGGWPAPPVRPPPGFAPPARAPAPPPEPRAYDPFRSLASIWAPAPNDWRAAPGDDQRQRDHRD